MLRLHDGPVRLSSLRSHGPDFRCGKPGSIVPLLSGYFAVRLLQGIRSYALAVARASPFAPMGPGRAATRVVVTAGRGPFRSGAIPSAEWRSKRRQPTLGAPLQRRSTSRSRARTVDRKKGRSRGQGGGPHLCTFDAQAGFGTVEFARRERPANLARRLNFPTTD
jgi:hypothetical protein